MILGEAVGISCRGYRRGPSRAGCFCRRLHRTIFFMVVHLVNTKGGYGDNYHDGNDANNDPDGGCHISLPKIKTQGRRQHQFAVFLLALQEATKATVPGKNFFVVFGLPKRSLSGSRIHDPVGAIWSAEAIFWWVFFLLQSQRDQVRGSLISNSDQNWHNSKSLSFQSPAD